MVDPKLIFTAALKLNASNIILCHNHPSGNLTPSAGDIGLMRKVLEAAVVMDITLVDHLIITTNGCCSLFEIL